MENIMGEKITTMKMKKTGVYYFCLKCNTTIEEEWIFCPKCGIKMNVGLQ